MAKSNKKKMLLAASVAGLLAVSGVAMSAGNVFAEDVNCAGVNACKGMGDCGGKGNSCAGKNACKGTGWVKTSTDVCSKIGGTVAV